MLPSLLALEQRKVQLGKHCAPHFQAALMRAFGISIRQRMAEVPLQRIGVAFNDEDLFGRHGNASQAASRGPDTQRLKRPPATMVTRAAAARFDPHQIRA
jgi:hypothetical protein